MESEREDVVRPSLGAFSAAAIIVGIVVGAGIFKLPQLVAMNSPNSSTMLLLWVAGGIISLLGAMCYSELATTYPNAGGEYHYLKRSFGADLAFLFGWARMTVIQTGAIAVSAFLIGDYLTSIRPLPFEDSSAAYALIVIGIITLINLLGIKPGSWTQNLLTLATIAGLVFVAVMGLGLAAPVTPAPAAPVEPTFSGAIGLGLVFVLYAFGGWNEAGYISAEVKDRRKDIVKALFSGIGAITILYLLANFAYLRAMGMEGMTESNAVAADLARIAIGETGAIVISLVVAVAAFSTANATAITGARTNYALGRDFRIFKFLGNWNESGNTPRNSLIVQGLIAMALVLFGAITTVSGFQTMVEYTAPVFWTFFLLAAVSLIVLRVKDPDRERPFRVPLYPLPPILFALACAYMLYSSLAYTGLGALFGVAVLALGVPLLVIERVKKPANQYST